MSAQTATSSLPVLDALYQTGCYYRDKGDVKNAETQLLNALEIAPDHVESRLLLAEIQIDNDRFDEGLRALQEVHKISEQAARSPLTHALLNRGNEVEESGYYDEALALYERALEVSPEDDTVQRKIAGIWLRRASEAEADDDLDGAIKAYLKAGREDEVSRCKASKLQRTVDAVADQARLFENQEQWQKACINYRVLRKRDPENQVWIEALTRAEMECDLAETYDKAGVAIEDQDWLAAVESLVKVVSVRPDYQRAAERLALAVDGRKSAESKPASGHPAAPKGSSVKKSSEPAASSSRVVSRWALASVLGAVLLLAAGVTYELTGPLAGAATTTSIAWENLVGNSTLASLMAFLTEARVLPTAPLTILTGLAFGGLCGWLLSSLRYRRVPSKAESVVS